jgi:hypothetical protein
MNATKCGVFTVGILTLDTHFPRNPGDMGNAATFPLPVR